MAPDAFVIGPLRISIHIGNGIQSSFFPVNSHSIVFHLADTKTFHLADHMDFEWSPWLSRSCEEIRFGNRLKQGLRILPRMILRLAYHFIRR